MHCNYLVFTKNREIERRGVSTIQKTIKGCLLITKTGAHKNEALDRSTTVGGIDSCIT